MKISNREIDQVKSEPNNTTIRTQFNGKIGENKEDNGLKKYEELNAKANTDTNIDTISDKQNNIVEANEKDNANETDKKKLIPKYDWLQNTKNVCITLFIKNMREEDVKKIEIKENSVEVVLQDDTTDRVFSFSLYSLYSGIIPSESSYQLTDKKMEIKLKKRKEEYWPSLQKCENDKAVSTRSLSTSSKIQVSSPYSKKTNWDKIEKEIDEETKQEDDGEEALQKLFRDIYYRGDEDTRRAMIKSFQTSGGTVLSTNWKEVEQRNYEEEMNAPDGQEVRFWNKK